MKYLKRYENFENDGFEDIVDQVFVDLIDRSAKINISINNKEKGINFKVINLFEHLSVNEIERKDTLDISLRAINNKEVYDGAIISISNLKIDSDVALVIETANDYLKTKGYEFIAMEADYKYYKDIILDKERILLYYKINGKN